MNCVTTVLHLQLVGIGLILQCSHYGLRLRVAVKTDVDQLPRIVSTAVRLPSPCHI